MNKLQEQVQRELSRLRGDDPTLTHVSFFYLNEAKVREVADALRCNTHLKSLRLHDLEVGDGGAAAIADALSDNNTLTRLCLEANRIGDDGAKANAAALSERNESGGRMHTSLIHLSLSDNEIGDDGGRALAAMLRSNTSITYLNLRNCGIGDDGAKALAAALVANDTIRRLTLSNNRIGDGGAKALAAANLLRLRPCCIYSSAFDLYRRLYFNGDDVVATDVPAAVALIEQLLPTTNFISIPPHKLSAIVQTKAAALRSAHPPKPGRLAILDTAQRLIIDHVLAQTRLIPDAAMPLVFQKIGESGDDDKNAIGHRNNNTGINALFEVCIDKPHLFKDAHMDEGMDGQGQGQGQGEEEETTQKTPQGNASDKSLRVPAQDMKKRSGKRRYRQMDITNFFGKKITKV